MSKNVRVAIGMVLGMALTLAAIDYRFDGLKWLLEKANVKADVANFKSHVVGSYHAVGRKNERTASIIAAAWMKDEDILRLRQDVENTNFYLGKYAFGQPNGVYEEFLRRLIEDAEKKNVEDHHITALRELSGIQAEIAHIWELVDTYQLSDDTLVEMKSQLATVLDNHYEIEKKLRSKAEPKQQRTVPQKFL